MSRTSATTAGSIPSGNGDASGGIPGAVSLHHRVRGLGPVLTCVQATSSPNAASNVALPALPILGAIAAFLL